MNSDPSLSEKVGAESLAESKPGPFRFVGYCFGLAMLLPLAGWLLLFLELKPLVNLWSFVNNTIPLAILVFLILYIGGHLTAPQGFKFDWKKFAVGLVLFPFWYVGVAMMLLAANQRWDGEPAERQVVRVLRKTSNSSTDLSRWVGYAHCQSWQEDGKEERFAVGIRLYQSIKPGKTRLGVFVHKGYLGYPWVEKIQSWNENK